ncbi:MAG: hypothetical protein PHQ41_09890 [Candidatus Cloacimonetes bacterium]|nr:hypothetical protein [Candidatus Cloacimonadota bacterium]MDD3524989.1 hypothetical protein [Candidatus Cloacimonadota bacterium]
MDAGSIPATSTNYYKKVAPESSSRALSAALSEKAGQKLPIIKDGDKRRQITAIY